MIEFNVNHLITLRLENDESVIYVNEEKFLICKRLILNISTNPMGFFDKIQSIDEVVGFSNKKQEIPANVEFWAHCSNIQTWVENNYDTKYNYAHKEGFAEFINE